MNAIVKWFPVWGRAVCYSVIALLVPLMDQISEVLTTNHWPTPQRWTLAVMAALISAATTLRAFFDGSVQRHADQLVSTANNAGQTTEAK